MIGKWAVLLLCSLSRLDKGKGGSGYQAAESSRSQFVNMATDSCRAVVAVTSAPMSDAVKSKRIEGQLA